MTADISKCGACHLRTWCQQNSLACLKLSVSDEPPQIDPPPAVGPHQACFTLPVDCVSVCACVQISADGQCCASLLTVCLCVRVCRYQQMGNAVSPCVAAALGRCLLLAAVAEAPADVDHAVLAVPDPEILQVSKGKELTGNKALTPIFEILTHSRKWEPETEACDLHKLLLPL